MNAPSAGDGWADRIRHGYWRLTTFISQDLWTVTPTGRAPRFLIHFLRMMVLVFEGSIRSDVFLLSAGLTYQIVFSLIPLLAVILAFFKAFGGMEGAASKLIPLLRDMFTDPKTGKAIEAYINDFVNQTNSTTIGVVGFLVLVVTSFSLLTSMEKSFNKVWAVHTFRPILRRLTTYWAILTIAPIFLGLSITASSFLQSQALYVWLSEKIPFFSTAVLTLTPYLFTWTVFTILYVMMPNTKVDFGAALIGALTAGSIWEFAKTAYLWYNTQFVGAYQIYGSLGAIPVFLLWVYISWVVVLIGAEISYAFQHVKTYRREIESPIVSQSFKEKLAVVIVLEACRAFIAGLKPPTGESIGARLNVPGRLVNDVVYQLIQQNTLRELRGPDKDDPGLVPARDPETMLVRDVIEAMRNYGAEPCPLPDGALPGKLEDLLHGEHASAANFKKLASAPPSGTG